MKDSYFVYILLCSDKSYYVGHTNDLKKRLETHNSGKATRYTSLRRPLKMVYSEKHENNSSACKRERQLKKWSRAKKGALITGDLNKLKKLGKKHN